MRAGSIAMGLDGHNVRQNVAWIARCQTETGVDSQECVTPLPLRVYYSTHALDRQQHVAVVWWAE